MSVHAQLCSIEDCVRPVLVRSRGWCSMHYARWKKHGDPTVTLLDRGDHPTCSVDGCMRAYYGKGYCEMHYARMRKRGNVGGATPERIDADGYQHAVVEDGRSGRVCTKCNEAKPLSAFNQKKGKSVVRYESQCRACANERSRQFRGSPEGRREYMRLRRERNRERYRSYYAKRRAMKKQAASYLVTDRDLRRIYSSPCVGCGATDNIEADHIIPVARGGRYSVGNLQPLCGSCNKSKGSKLMAEWRLRHA